ncbi:hypothetical protein C7974DRAFT_376686 [Boeremia exigua]|uniref:uncharacterized protein n=1 Tax=Boeremia exigua TaxID=749465 RepID=UPI001E8DDAF6|nr:uncharacterized protein C7974DRAFT_376686 [Boeremia exigua]KAH6625116.1 hypothetical protein C7974DRAFT_376686 [Boeremia exigua]
MASSSLGRQALWQHSHSITILFAVLLFTAGFLCTLLWTNGIVETASSVTTNTLNQFSPAVSTFSITYQVAIFGTAWNALLFVSLLVLERDDIPIPTPRLRYEIEKAASIVAVVGNAVYAVACIALMATLGRLAADAMTPKPGISPDVAERVAQSASDRRAGQGVTAAVAGLAAASAVCACVMDVLHAQDSSHRRLIKGGPPAADSADKQA